MFAKVWRIIQWGKGEKVVLYFRQLLLGDMMQVASQYSKAVHFLTAYSRSHKVDMQRIFQMLGLCLTLPFYDV